MEQNDSEAPTAISDEELRELFPLAKQYFTDLEAEFDPKTLEWLNHRYSEMDLEQFSQAMRRIHPARFAAFKRQFQMGYAAHAEELRSRCMEVLGAEEGHKNKEEEIERFNEMTPEELLQELFVEQCGMTQEQMNEFLKSYCEQNKDRLAALVAGIEDE